MKISYKVKTLIDGYKLGISFSGKVLVAIPIKKAIPGAVIAYKNSIMRLPGEMLKAIDFSDKYGRGTYTLCYYLWKPAKLWE